MSTNIEIEVKALLNENDYQRVLDFFKDELKEPVEQVNYYIDTKTSDLRRHEISLRIRQLNGFMMTLKTPLSEGLLEKNQLISEHEFVNFIKNKVFPDGVIGEFLERLYIEPADLIPLASLTTIRYNISYNGMLLAIDKNTYNDKVDYELEMEGNSVEKARVYLEEVCQNVGIDFVENRVSKQKRALEAHKVL